MSSQDRIRLVLRAGAGVFLVSAIVLLLAPGWFAEQLGLQVSDATSWTMRMLAGALLALSGQMVLVSRGAEPERGAMVMLVGGGVLTVLTMVVPGPWTWLRVAYVAFGAAFWLAYVALLLAGRRESAA